MPTFSPAKTPAKTPAETGKASSNPVSHTNRANDATLSQVAALKPRILTFLHQHMSANAAPHSGWSGEFALYRGETSWDLYGAVDAVYALHTIGALEETTTPATRREWRRRILSCQAADGWFTLRNRRGHGPEHATAYALGALQLLADLDQEEAFADVRPVQALRPLLSDADATHDWLHHLGFTSWRGALRKNVGWHYVWRSSHIGGGVGAIIVMLGARTRDWWPDTAPPDTWCDWYFSWLDREINPATGLWQRAFWNRVYRRPTLIDLGGAVHFYWIYAAAKRPFPAPAALIDATLPLQKPSGLYKEHPFCIDLDANFCLLRPLAQLDQADRLRRQAPVRRALERNLHAIVTRLSAEPLDAIYQDSHGLPGALAAVSEAARLPDLNLPLAEIGWRHVLDSVPWL